MHHALVAVLFLAATLSPDSTSAQVEGRVGIPGTTVNLVPPEGFTPSSAFPGYQQLDSGCSLMVNMIPGPFDQVAAGFSDPIKLARQGMRVESREERGFEEIPGLFLTFEQTVNGGGVFAKCVWMLGTDERSVIVMGTCPEQAKDAVFADLKAAVLSARWDPESAVDPFEGAGFVLTDHEGLKYHSRLANNLVFTAHGAPPAPGISMLMVGPGIGPAPPGKRKDSAAQLRSSLQVSGDPDSTKAVKVDGLPGIETMATYARDGQDVTEYCLILFDGVAFWSVIGRGLADEEMLPTFQKTARSFQRDAFDWSTADGENLVTVRGGWNEIEPQIDGDLHLAHSVGELYLVVDSVPKVEAEMKGLRPFARYCNEGLVELSEDPEAGEFSRVQLGGRKGLEATFTLEVEGMPALYLSMVLESDFAYHHVLCWGLENPRTDTLKSLRSVVRTFRASE